MYDAATGASRRELHMVKGATHYFEGQPELLDEALDAMVSFITANVGGL